jgi:nitrite reductase/ring-hydroxylating ferredoxin subunit
MAWTKVLNQDALSPDGRKVVKVGQRAILLINQNGQLYAVDNICPHLKAPLSKGKLTEDGAIVCPFHRSVFDLGTGTVKQWCPWPPAIGSMLGKVVKEKTLPVFPTRIDEGSIWVDI